MRAVTFQRGGQRLAGSHLGQIGTHGGGGDPVLARQLRTQGIEGVDRAGDEDQVVALARVTASAYGYNREDQHGFRAARYEQACKLLGVEV